MLTAAIIDNAAVVDIGVRAGGGGVQGGRREGAAILWTGRMVEGPLPAAGALQGQFL